MGLSGGSIPKSDPMEEARARDWEEQQRQARDAATAAEAQRKRDEDLARQRGEFDTSISSATNSARTNAQNRLSGMGLDMNRFNPLIDQRINDMRSRTPDLASNVSNYINDSFIDDLLSTETAADRSKYKKSIDSAFSPTYDTDAFNDMSDDDVISALLGEKQNPARQQIENAKARGTLNDTGYTAALQDFDRQSQAAGARLQSLGSNVRSGYQQTIRDIINSAYDTAGRMELGQNFDLGAYQNRANSTINDLRGRMSGDLRNMIGDDPLFDLDSLILSGGTAQGPQAGEPGYFADAEAQRRKKERDRGLGSQGGF